MTTKYQISKKQIAEVYESSKRDREAVVVFLLNKFNLWHCSGAVETIKTTLRCSFFNNYEKRLKYYREKHKPTANVMQESWLCTDLTFEIKTTTGVSVLYSQGKMSITFMKLLKFI